jgi:hypothetical protein
MSSEEDSVFDRAMRFFRGHTRAYRQVFNRQSPAVQYVLADMEEFCCANRTTVGATDRDLAVREGRRQVWLRLQRALNLTPEEMFALARRKDQINA